MDISLKVSIKPFQVPNFVIINRHPGTKQEGFVELPSIPLSDLDAGQLSALCDEFRDSVFEKAGKQQPPTCVG